WDGDTTLIFTPNQRLPFDTQFTVQIGAGFEDTVGNATTAPTDAWTFRTVGLPLVTGASPAGTDPVPVDATVTLTFDPLMATTADAASGVSVRGPIAVAFDAPIDPGSVAGSLEITPPVGGSFSVVATPSDAAVVSPSPSESPSGSPPGRLLLFTPDGALAAHTTYTVTLRPVIHRLGSAEQVASGGTWTFTTGQPATSAQNQV